MKHEWLVYELCALSLASVEEYKVSLYSEIQHMHCLF